MKDTLKSKMFIRIILISLGIILYFSKPAYAYMDPSSGSMFVQLLLAGLASLAIMGKCYWRQIKLFFRNLFFRNRNQDNNDK
ncbi:MAG: hypothetical protein V1749_03455 [Candidatus Desantisbacteria bacterium]